MKAKILMAAITVLMTKGIQAGDFTDARVIGVFCAAASGTKEVCSVYFNKSLTSSPCSTNYKYRMQIDASTASGKALLSVALTANAQNKYVAAISANSCLISGDTEDLQLLFISPKCAELNTWGCTNL